MEDRRRQVLTVLQGDARLTAEQIGAMLGLAAAEVAQEIAALEAERVILGYRAVIDWDRTGADSVVALIDVKVTPQREVGFDKVAERIYGFSEVRSVSLMSGTYDLSVLVEAPTLKEVARFVSEKLASLEHVASTTTHFILKRYKQDGFVFGDGDDDRRLAVSP